MSNIHSFAVFFKKILIVYSKHPGFGDEVSSTITTVTCKNKNHHLQKYTTIRQIKCINK